MNRARCSWMSGAATQRFAVDVGTPMEGYLARIGPASGTHDDLQASALALCKSGKRIIVVTADVAAVDFALVNEIATSAGVDRSELVVCASHTHSGPAGIVPNLHPGDMDRTDPALRASFIETCVTTVNDALDRLEPVNLLFGRSDTSGLAANRNSQDGPYDPRISVLATRTPSGEIRSALVHFACHPTILGADSRVISADFPGALRRALGASLKADDRLPVILYANGAAGDVSTRYTRQNQDVDEVERVGTRLAAAAHVALSRARNVHGSIGYARENVDLTPRTLLTHTSEDYPPDNDVLADLSEAEQRREETRRQGASLFAKLMNRGPEHIPTSVDIEAWALGDLSFVAVPGELFSSVGTMIADASSSPTLILGYANGYVGYLADTEAYEHDTYEALASPFAPGAGERVEETARRLITQLRAEFGERFSDQELKRSP